MTSRLTFRLLLGTFATTIIAWTAAHAGPSAPSDGKRAVDEGPDAAKLWAQNCSRCHNLRPAKAFSDAEWDLIVHHMRVRANITGADARLIAEFLKGGN